MVNAAWDLAAKRAGKPLWRLLADLATRRPTRGGSPGPGTRCRVAGVNENVAILLLAAKFGVPVCPHAGGVGLCEMVQQLAMFDLIAVSGTSAGRVLEYVDHRHEHCTEPVEVSGGRYLPPDAPGGSVWRQAVPAGTPASTALGCSGAG